MSNPLRFVMPYGERNSVRVQEHIQTLLRPAPVALTDAQRQDAYAFARGLFDGVAEVGSSMLRVAMSMTLGEVYALAPGAGCTWYLGYFMEDGGKELAVCGIPPNATKGDVRAALYAQAEAAQAAHIAAHKAAAAASRQWYVRLLAGQVRTGDDTTVDAEQVTLHYEPARLLYKMEALQAYQDFYAAVLQALQACETSDTVRAQQALAEVYAARADCLVATIAPDLCAVARQLHGAGTPSADGLLERIGGLLPDIVEALKDGDDARYAAGKQALARQCDHVRNGVVALPDKPEGVVYGPVRQLRDLPTLPTGPLPPPRCTPAIARELAASTWDSTQMADFLRSILHGADLLSTETTGGDASDDAAAADGKWRVAIHPQRHNLSVIPRTRTVYVPASFNRPLVGESPAGALAVAAHELTHVMQSEYDARTAAFVPLAGIKGRRFMTLREAGGMYQGNRLQAYAGVPVTAKLAYLEAWLAREAGGNLVAAARAFYTSLLSSTADEDEQVRLSKLAVDRALRFYRWGGYDTQPLDYVEQLLIMQALEPLTEAERRMVTVATTSFCLADAAKLHEAGVFDAQPAIWDGAEVVLAAYLHTRRAAVHES